MKRYFAGTLLCLCLFGSLLPLSAQRRTENTVRVMSYNIRNCRGMDGETDLGRTAGIILRAGADVVALQEVDSMTLRSGGIDLAARLAGATKMYGVYAPAIDFEGGKYGVAVLSRQKPLWWRSVALPGREEARRLLVVEMEDYVIFCTHLSLDAEDRLASATIINREAARFDKPVLLAGDLNARPDSAPVRKLAESWRMLNDPKAATFPADEPNTTIDYVWGHAADGRTYSVHRRSVENETVASDHRPVVVDVRVSVPRSAIMRTAPYLQNPAPNAVTVMWHTTVPCYSWVEYGVDSTKMVRARNLIEGETVANTTGNRVRVEGLAPGTKYYYRVCSREITLYQPYSKEFGATARSPISSFTTFDDRATDFTAVIFNDLHDNKPLFDTMRALVADVPYDMVFFNGDCIPDVQTEEIALAAIDYYGRGVGADRVPCIFLRGNHETRGAYSPFLWNLLERQGGRSFGAFDVGDTRFVLLDCGEDKPDDHPAYSDMNDFTQHRLDQRAFLERETASREFRRAAKRVLIHHIPVYGNNDKYNPCRELWGGVLSRARFDVALSGHTHTYAWLPAGSAEGNSFPVMIGGGSTGESATVAVLTKRDKVLTLKVMDSTGKTLLEKEL